MDRLEVEKMEEYTFGMTDGSVDFEWLAQDPPPADMAALLKDMIPGADIEGIIPREDAIRKEVKIVGDDSLDHKLQFLTYARDDQSERGAQEIGPLLYLAGGHAEKLKEAGLILPEELYYEEKNESTESNFCGVVQVSKLLERLPEGSILRFRLVHYVQQELDQVAIRENMARFATQKRKYDGDAEKLAEIEEKQAAASRSLRLFGESQLAAADAIANAFGLVPNAVFYDTQDNHASNFMTSVHNLREMLPTLPPVQK